jgi:hypothetical protein
MFATSSSSFEWAWTRRNPVLLHFENKQTHFQIDCPSTTIQPSETNLEECLAACTACFAACECCAAACLRAEDVKAMAPLIALARACADVCSLTARLLAQRSEFSVEYCGLCAEVCHTCREECLKHTTEAHCADTLLKCEQACQRFASADQTAVPTLRA